MNPVTLELLCDPTTYHRLQFRTETDGKGLLHEFLFRRSSNKKFPMRGDIPIFIDREDVLGSLRGNNYCMTGLEYYGLV